MLEILSKCFHFACTKFFIPWETFCSHIFNTQKYRRISNYDACFQLLDEVIKELHFQLKIFILLILEGTEKCRPTWLSSTTQLASSMKQEMHRFQLVMLAWGGYRILDMAKTVSHWKWNIWRSFCREMCNEEESVLKTCQLFKLGQVRKQIPKEIVERY